MAKFRQGNIVLQSNQTIEQLNTSPLPQVILGEDAAARVDTLIVDTSVELGGTLVFSAAGATISQFDDDPTLAADTDTRVPTQQAVKTYVDNKISGSISAGVDESVAIYQGTDSIQDSLVFIDSTGGVTGIANLSVNQDIDCTVINALNVNASGEIVAIGNITGDDLYVTNCSIVNGDLVTTGDITCNDLFTSGSTINVGTGQIKSTAGNIELHYGVSKELQTDAGGIKLKYGQAVNEFSNDSTSDSTSIILTSAAVQNIVGDFSADRIEDGNTSVIVSDIGPPRIEGTVNSTKLLEIDEAWQTIGDVTDTYLQLWQDTNSVAFNSGGVQSLYVSNIQQTFGINADARISITPGSNLITAAVDGDIVISLGTDVQRFGKSTDTYFEITQSADTFLMYAGTTKIFEANNETQIMGLQTDTYCFTQQSTNHAGFVVGTVVLLDLETNTQRLGKTNTYVALDQGANSIALMANNIEGAYITPGSQTFGTGGFTSITLNQGSGYVNIASNNDTRFYARPDLAAMGDGYGPSGTYVAVNPSSHTANIVMNGINSAYFSQNIARLYYAGATCLTTKSGNGVTVNGNSDIPIDNESSNKKMKARDHSTGTSPEVGNIVYGTGSPPTASTTPIGTIFVKYIA